MKREYLVQGKFNFVEKSLSPEEVRTGIVNTLKREGLNEVNFEISIERVSGGKDDVNENVQNTITIVQPKEKMELPQKRTSKDRKFKTISMKKKHIVRRKLK